MADPRLPNLLIAGVEKGGTTSLHYYLQQHSEICSAATNTQVRYFTPLLYGEGNLGPLDDYAKAFRRCEGGKYMLEASSHYYFGGGPLIEALQQTLQRPRVLISLREPVKRLWSYYNFMKSLFMVPQSLTFAEYVEISERLRQEGSERLFENRAYHALSTGFYIEWITDWLEAFDDDIRVVFFEELVHDPPSVVRGICEWLAIDSKAANHLDYAPLNKTVKLRSKQLRAVAGFSSGLAQRWLKRDGALRSVARNVYLHLNADTGEAERLDPAIKRRLEGVYGPSNRLLAEELRRRNVRSLPAWLNVGADERQGLSG